MAADTVTTTLVFYPATSHPLLPGTYLVAYSWHHPKSQHGLLPHSKLEPGQLPTTQLSWGSHPWEDEEAPLSWASQDGEPLNEFMKVEAWARMPIYQPDKYLGWDAITSPHKEPAQ